MSAPTPEEIKRVADWQRAEEKRKHRAWLDERARIEAEHVAENRRKAFAALDAHIGGEEGWIDRHLSPEIQETMWDMTERLCGVDQWGDTDYDGVYSASDNLIELWDFAWKFRHELRQR